MKRLCATHGARTPSFASGIPALAATELGRSCYRAATQSRYFQDKSPANPFALFAAPEPQNACSWLHLRGGSYLRRLVGETGFEPATARPPAQTLGYRSGDEARIHWVFCLPMLFSFAQFVPRSVPRAYVRIGFATPPWVTPWRSVAARARRREARDAIAARLPTSFLAIARCASENVSARVSRSARVSFSISASSCAELADIALQHKDQPPGTHGMSQTAVLRQSCPSTSPVAGASRGLRRRDD
jgi:hypothetical protein